MYYYYFNVLKDAMKTMCLIPFWTKLAIWKNIAHGADFDIILLDASFQNILVIWDCRINSFILFSKFFVTEYEIEENIWCLSTTLVI